jgi:hypothetical protein
LLSARKSVRCIKDAMISGESGVSSPALGTALKDDAGISDITSRPMLE